MDANGQINFAGADMAGTSYLPNEAVFLPATVGGQEAFTQPDLPPISDQKTKPNQTKAKGKKNKQLQPAQPAAMQVAGSNPAAAVAAAAAGNAAAVAAGAATSGVEATSGIPVDPSNDILQFQPVVDPASVGSMQPLETYEAYTAAAASAAVDLDSETDSNHDTALTLACAGGHEELVTLLINRGANIGKKFLFFWSLWKFQDFRLLHRFYVKSILGIVEVRKLPFIPFEGI